MIDRDMTDRHMTDRETAAELTALARHLLKHGNADDAVILLDSALALQPDDLAIAGLQCEAAHAVGRDVEASERLALLIDASPAGARADLELLHAKVLLALGRRDLAAAVYRRARPMADDEIGLFNADVSHSEDPAP
jgi:hypothetical protein